MQQQITIEDITAKEFKKVGGHGYDAEEVDNFLDAICDQMERDEQQMKEMQRQLTEARTQLSAAREQVQSLTAQLNEAQSALASAPVPVAAPAAPKDDPNEAAVGVLAMAQQMKQQILADAQAQADEILQEAERRARERLGSLVDDKEAAERQLATIKETITTYRTRFAEMVQAQQTALDALEDL